VKVGAEPKKVVTLVALLGVAGAIFYYQVSSDSSTAAAPARSVSPPPSPARASAEQGPDSGSARARPTQRSTGDFKPTLKRTKAGESLDPARVDPTLRIDLLAKIQGVTYEGVERNLFLFGTAKPKVTTPPSEPPKPVATVPPPPKPGANEPSAAPSKPPPPPINMKYFGFANRPGDARKRAFFMDGEEIVVAAEGEVIKKRYKVVRIGINSVVVEDLDHKSQQTLPLQEG
jgi:hypothetical protein